MTAPPDRFEWERAVREDPQITRTRLAVLLTLATHWDRRRGITTVRMSTIADQTGASLRAVQDQLRWAVQSQWLARAHRGHRQGDGQSVGSSYSLRLPSQQVCETPVDQPPQLVPERPVEASLNTQHDDALLVPERPLNRHCATDAPLPSSEGGSEKPIALARNELWDAVMAACDVDAGSITDSARAGYGKVVAELRRVGATADDVHRRASIYRDRYPRATLTPHALAKHWAQCAKAPPVGSVGLQMARPTTDDRVAAGIRLAEQLAGEGR